MSISLWNMLQFLILLPTIMLWCPWQIKYKNRITTPIMMIHVLQKFYDSVRVKKLKRLGCTTPSSVKHNKRLQKKEVIFLFQVNSQDILEQMSLYC